MATVSRTFTVQVPPSTVIPYLADFAHAEEWDPGTVSCTPNQPGPPAVGSTWANTSKIFGVSSDLTYELTELTDRRVVLVGTNKTATSTERIDVTPSGTGSNVTYVNETIFNGAAKLAAPLVRIVFEKIAGDTVRQLSGALNGLGG